MSCPVRQMLMDFVDGRPTQPEMIVHMRSCASCNQVLRDAKRAHAQLTESGEGAKIALQPSTASLSRVWDNVRFRIRRMAAASSEPSIGLEQLRSIMASMFGSATADSALKSARSEGMASDLGSVVEVICGDKAGNLVRRTARVVNREEVA